MIAKQVQGRDFRGVLDYVSGKKGAKLIGGNVVGKDPATIAAEFRAASDLRRKLTKCVYHVSLSVSPAENLSERKWMAIAQAYLKGMEFSGSQYVVYRHTDRDHDHIHVIASRVRLTDGTAVRDSWQYRRSEVLVRQLEQEFGLQPTHSSWERQERAPKTGEIRRSRRTGEPSKRVELQRTVREVLQRCQSLESFIEALSLQDVSVRLRRSASGKIQGISYELNGIAFQGRKLGKDYTWQSIQATLENNGAAIAFGSPRAIAPTVEQAHLEAILPDLESLPEVSEATSQLTETPINITEKTTEIEVRERYRVRYLKLVENILSQPSFTSPKMEDIDTGVALLVLKDSDLKEAKAILGQSDTVRAWKASLPAEQYQKTAEDYLLWITKRAMALSRPPNRSQDTGLEL
jgi:hypothetical protein